ncbi:MAG: lipopolysaccharide biosynthesis protein [Proteobacteria bacterium]|nr:lipopolysaccharide biosynthesis protein [Pseudomonadota bacterium]
MQNAPHGSLHKRVIESGFWIFVLRVANQILSLIKMVILARILTPHDFGLAAVAMLTISTLEAFSQTGFQAALIQKEKSVREYLDSAWITAIARGAVLFSVIYFIAPRVSIFFNVSEATPIIRTVALILLIQGFNNIGVIYFQKDLEFKKEFMYQISGTFVEFIVAVSVSLLLKNVWGLVFGLLAGNCTTLIASYLLHPYKPHFYFDFKKIKDLLNFGVWVFGSSILIFLTSNGDNMVVGKMLGVSMLGLYQMSYRFGNLPTTEITHMVSKIAFPTYSKLKNDLIQLRDAYLKVLQFTLFFSFCAGGLMFSLADEFTKIILGDKWLPMVMPLKILVFAGMARSVSATAGPILYATGQPIIDTKMQTLRFFILAILIYPLTSKGGLIGASIAVFISELASSIGFTFFAIKRTYCGVWKFIRILYPLLINLFITICLISVLRNALPSYQLLWFILIACSGVFTYFILFYPFDRLINYGIYSLMRGSISILIKKVS